MADFLLDHATKVAIDIIDSALLANDVALVFHHNPNVVNSIDHEMRQRMNTVQIILGNQNLSAAGRADLQQLLDDFYLRYFRERAVQLNSNTVNASSMRVNSSCARPRG